MFHFVLLIINYAATVFINRSIQLIISQLKPIHAIAINAFLIHLYHFFAFVSSPAAVKMINQWIIMYINAINPNIHNV